MTQMAPRTKSTTISARGINARSSETRHASGAPPRSHRHAATATTTSATTAPAFTQMNTHADIRSQLSRSGRPATAIAAALTTATSAAIHVTTTQERQLGAGRADPWRRTRRSGRATPQGSARACGSSSPPRSITPHRYFAQNSRHLTAIIRIHGQEVDDVTCHCRLDLD
jgi:hypothetical protein